MGVRNTSRQAYFNDVVPKINEAQMVVLSALQKSKRPVNNQEVSNFLGKPINTITPRMGELVEKGLVEEAFRAIYPVTNRKVIYWRKKQ